MLVAAAPGPTARFHLFSRTLQFHCNQDVVHYDECDTAAPTSPRTRLLAALADLSAYLSLRHQVARPPSAGRTCEHGK